MARTTRSRQPAAGSTERPARAARQPLASKPINFTPQKQPATKKRNTKNTRQKENLSKPPSPDHGRRQSTPELVESSSSSRMSPGLLARSPGAPAQALMTVKTDKRPRMIASSAVKATPSFVANFKRRARQPSILSMVQQQDLGQAADVQDESTMFSLGHSSPADRLESPIAAPSANVSAAIELPSSSPPLPQSASSPQPLSLKRKRGHGSSFQSSSRRSLQMQDNPMERPSTASPESTPPTSTNKRRGTTKPKKTRQTRSQPVLTTSELQALLPKRRRKEPQRRQSEFDVMESDSEDRSPTPSGSEESDDDDDEIKMYSRRRPLVTKSNTTTKQTYGRRKHKKSSIGIENKENRSNAMAAVPPSKELEEAARKFKEIDEWELSFESQDLGGAGGSSSPWR